MPPLLLLLFRSCVSACCPVFAFRLAVPFLLCVVVVAVGAGCAAVLGLGERGSAPLGAAAAAPMAEPALGQALPAPAAVLLPAQLAPHRLSFAYNSN